MWATVCGLIFVFSSALSHEEYRARFLNSKYFKGLLINQKDGKYFNQTMTTFLLQQIHVLCILYLILYEQILRVVKISY